MNAERAGVHIEQARVDMKQLPDLRGISSTPYDTTSSALLRCCGVRVTRGLWVGLWLDL